MTVLELRRILEGLPPNMEVWVDYDGMPFRVTECTRGHYVIPDYDDDGRHLDVNNNDSPDSIEVVKVESYT